MNRNQNYRRSRRDRNDQDYGRQSEQFADSDYRFSDDDRDFGQMGGGGRSTYGQSDNDSYGQGYGANYGSSFERPGDQRDRGFSDRGSNNDRSFFNDRDHGDRSRSDRQQGSGDRSEGYSSGGYGSSNYGNRDRGFGGSGSDDYGDRDSGRRGNYGSGRNSGDYGAFGAGSYGGGSSGGGLFGGSDRGGSSGGSSYGERGYGSGQGRNQSRSDRDNRGFFERAGDEVASWFGDEDAARRRENDHSGRGPSNYTRSDERVLEDACDHLTDDRRVDAQNIQVTVQNGEVTLDGTVSSREQKRRAEDCVHDISGVKHVQNNLRINQSSDWNRTSDRNDNNRGSSMGSGTTGVSGGYGSTDRDDDTNRSDSTTGTLA